MSLGGYCGDICKGPCRDGRGAGAAGRGNVRIRAQTEKKIPPPKDAAFNQWRRGGPRSYNPAGFETGRCVFWYGIT